MGHRLNNMLLFIAKIIVALTSTLVFVWHGIPVSAFAQRGVSLRLRDLVPALLQVIRLLLAGIVSVSAEEVYRAR